MPIQTVVACGLLALLVSAGATFGAEPKPDPVPLRRTEPRVGEVSPMLPLRQRVDEVKDLAKFIAESKKLITQFSGAERVTFGNVFVSEKSGTLFACGNMRMTRRDAKGESLYQTDHQFIVSPGLYLFIEDTPSRNKVPLQREDLHMWAEFSSEHSRFCYNPVN